jgi:LPS export ABC transporter permease LptG/LPS export ABC transporter permease LptF
MIKLFDRYILKEIFPPFLIGLLVYSFVLLMNQILLLSELFIDKGVPFGITVKIFVYLVPSVLAFALPMAVLMGILAGLSRMSSDSEVVAFKTLGISTRRLLWPVFIFAFGGWLVTSVLTLYLAPWANYKWVQTFAQSVLSKVQFKINPRDFNEAIPNTVIFIQDISRDNNWQNIFVYSTSNAEEPRVILARRGQLNFYPAQKRATLELFDGFLHSSPKASPEKYSVTVFERDEEDINVESLYGTVSSEKRIREKDIRELWSELKTIRADLAKLRADRAEAPSPKTKEIRQRLRDFQGHWVEVHKKLALPSVCFIFVLLGVPLGISTKKGGRTSGFTISIGIILVYYVLITGGEKLALDGRLSPFVGMWGPNLLLLLVGVYLFLKSLRETALFSSLGRLLKRKKGAPARRPHLLRGRSWPRPAVRFPNILDRYLIRKYLSIFCLVFMALLSISVIVTFFEGIDNIFEHNKSLLLLVRYIGYRIPEFVSYILPVAALTTTLLSLGLLTKSNEVTAMKACGISVYRMILPVILTGLITSFFSFYDQEWVLPFSNRKVEEAWNKINDVPPRSYSYVNRHWVLGQDRERIYHYDYFDPQKSDFSQLSIFTIDRSSWSLKRRIQAEKARLEGNELVLKKYWVRDFSNERPVTFEAAKEMRLRIAESKSYFMKEWKEPGQMTYGELDEHIRSLEGMGFETTRFKVDLAYKISFPFVAVVMTLLGIPFAFSMGKRGTLVGIGLSIVIAMIYWGAVGLFKSFGYVNVLSPFLAAWGPNLVFGLTGLYLTLRLRT